MIYIKSAADFFTRPYDLNNIYSQPLSVDLEQDEKNFFLHHMPNQKNTVDHLFSLKETRASGQTVSLSTLLQSTVSEKGDDPALKKMGFRQLNPDPETGLTLEHASLPGWLIKKNYSFVYDQGTKKIVAKAVGSNRIPRWMAPPSVRQLPKEIQIGFQTPNGAINPLRVEMLNRGRKWIEDLSLTHLKTASEYLLTIPGSPPAHTAPLHERVVVISKKEPILDEASSIQRWAVLASEKPETLKTIANQICLFITCNPLTDLHMHNIRFLSDNTDTVVFIDGEPIGAVAEASDERTLEAIQQYDRGFFPILGLRKLQDSIPIQMSENNISKSSIARVQNIFNEAIDKRIQVILWERKWVWFRDLAPEFFLSVLRISTIFMAFCASLYILGRLRARA